MTPPWMNQPVVTVEDLAVGAEVEERAGTVGGAGDRHRDDLVRPHAAEEVAVACRIGNHLQDGRLVALAGMLAHQLVDLDHTSEERLRGLRLQAFDEHQMI